MRQKIKNIIEKNDFLKKRSLLRGHNYIALKFFYRSAGLLTYTKKRGEEVLTMKYFKNYYTISVRAVPQKTKFVKYVFLRLFYITLNY